MYLWGGAHLLFEEYNNAGLKLPHKMALLSKRFLFLCLHQNAYVPCRLLFGKKIEPSALTTGREMRELLQEEAGIIDPYGLVTTRGTGTKEFPNLVPSAFDSRIIGCECPDDCFNYNWMWLHKGEPKRCGCGYWFELVHTPPI